MATPLSELPALEITPPPSPRRRRPKPERPLPPPHALHGAPARKSIPSKFVNKPPEPLYYFEDGLRKVHPYYYTYNTYCKERWRGRTLLDIFVTEFRDRPEEYYKEAIAADTICVSGTDKTGRHIEMRTGVNAIVKNGDMISHTTHRHEPPVTARPVGIAYEDDGLIAIDKPAGVPVHPAGRYNYNSVVEIMRSERPGLNPLPCNRLDRLTSGLMFIGKTPAAADAMMKQLRTRTIRKQYVARVKGRFPDGDIVCEQPILLISPKLGLNRVKADGKHAKTMFRRLKHVTTTVPGQQQQQDYSIVECHPFTGRTHQIRVHLQYLGFPIQNDPIYCNRRVFGSNLGKGGDGDDDDIITRLNRMGKQEVADAEAYWDEINEDYRTAKAEKLSGSLCEDCQTPLYTDPGPHELGIFLHAKRYECIEGKWAYETPLPEWATKDD